MVQLGDELTLKVLSFDKQGQKVSLGLKQLVPDPWENIAGKYPEGEKYKGKVTNLADYGAFVELEPGLKGWSTSPRCPGPASCVTRARWSTSATKSKWSLSVDPDKKRIRWA
jgi:SSU ribosomal protein S1P